LTVVEAVTSRREYEAVSVDGYDGARANNASLVPRSPISIVDPIPRTYTAFTGVFAFPLE